MSKDSVGIARGVLLAGLGIASLLATEGLQAAEAPKSVTAYQDELDPYKNYENLDAYLGDNVSSRFFNYYRLEWGKAGPPADPKAPPSTREGWPTTPMTSPPMPFTEWPYGGSTTIGVTRPASVDSPLMAAIANTDTGKWMAAHNIQTYGWVNVGGNLSTNHTRPGGNAPAAYDYTPNTVELDQAVVYVERLPDTVQTDHVDWGFRLSAIYGENYRYTTTFGIASSQLLRHNQYDGYDFPMVYGELYIPQVAEGLLLRLGRFISLPDIEAQLAPNNYMYSHSLTYTFDNYTNHGLQATLAVTKNFFLQAGIALGTDTAPWNMGQHIRNYMPGNALYPGTTYPKDPGNKPSGTFCARYQTDSGNDNLYLCADAINGGEYGYNNLQWFGGTYYHKFDDKWHNSFESYYLFERGAPNVNNPAVGAIIAGGGSPFSPINGFLFNAPNGAQCNDPTVFKCTARVFTLVDYLNYRVTDLDNISFRSEFYNDMQGQRTGVKTRYVEFGLGWQHWFSPQIYIRPEVTYYKSIDAKAFNGNFNNAQLPDRSVAVVAAMDLIWKF